MAKTIEFTTTSWKKPNAYESQRLNSSCFLDPKNRKYPIKKANDGPIYVHALVAAAHYSDVSMWNDPAVFKKAHELLDLYHKSVEQDLRTTKSKAKRTTKRRK